jgi:hypothetical protein|tara:strand:- start:310 stop:513 length:204 start_codon:yes stop_codon:yes gene_type:complete
MLNEFMNNLWGSGCTGVMVPGLGEIIDVRCKYGTDLQATIQTSGGKMVLRDGTELFEEFPNLFSESA